ncbi:MAG: hypothetical protein RIQ95_621 [Pseudomonadota bacterium]
MNLILRLVVLVLMGYQLAACSGGEDKLAEPSVSASNLLYGQKAKFTLGVTALRPDVVITVDGCTNLTKSADSSKSEEIFECEVKTSGVVAFKANDASGKLVFSKNFLVPDPQVRVTTSVGSFTIDLYPAKAPVTVDNFLGYVGSKFYEGILIHRVIPGFVVQMGGFFPGMQPKATNDPIVLESNKGLSNVRGSLGMARTNDPNSATSQFFVNIVDNRFLDYASESSPGYAVFGAISAGMDVIDLIAQRPTQTVAGVFQNVPVTDILMLNATRIR